MAMLDVLKKQHPTGVLRSFPRAYTSLVAGSDVFANWLLLSTGKLVYLVGLYAWRAPGNAAADIRIGEGTTQLLPDLRALAGVGNNWTCDDGSLPLLAFETTVVIATLVAQAAAPNDLRVKGTFFEF